MPRQERIRPVKVDEVTAPVIVPVVPAPAALPATIRVRYPDTVVEVDRSNLIEAIKAGARERNFGKVVVRYMEMEVYPNEIPVEAQEVTVVPYDAPGKKVELLRCEKCRKKLTPSEPALAVQEVEIDIEGEFVRTDMTSKHYHPNCLQI